MALLSIYMVSRRVLFEMILRLYFWLKVVLLLTLAHTLIVNL